MLWSNYRMRVKAPCVMNLAMFPFDEQKCTLAFEAYSYNIQEVQLVWHANPVTFLNAIDLPDFELTGFNTDRLRMHYPNGYWDQLQVSFRFKRRYGFYLFQVELYIGFNCWIVTLRRLLSGLLPDITYSDNKLGELPLGC